jgi:hypothetical protein
VAQQAAQPRQGPGGQAFWADGADVACERLAESVEAASFLVERPAAEDDRSTTHCAAGSPSSRRSVASVVRRLVRALSSRTRGQNSRANRERGCRPGLSAIQAKSDLALPLLIRGSGWPSHSILTEPGDAEHPAEG